MSEKENMAIVRRVVDAFDKGNVDILDEVCAANLVYHNPIGPDMDRAGIKKAQAMMVSAFPVWQSWWTTCLPRETRWPRAQQCVASTGRAVGRAAHR